MSVARGEQCARCGLVDAAVGDHGASRPTHSSHGHCLVALQHELVYHQTLMVWVARHLHGRKWQDVFLEVPEPSLPDESPIPVIRAEDFWPWVAELRRDDPDL